MLKMIMAANEKGLIGNKNKLPWHISEELTLFKETTVNNILIMGRKTWDSLPIKPLPKRESIVISRQERTDDVPKSVHWCNSFESALDLAKKIAGDRDIFVIGGASIYEEALEHVEEIILSIVYGEHVGDVYFPISKIKNNFLKNKIEINKSEKFVTHYYHKKK